MKYFRNLVKSVPLLLAGCVGGAATVWSPISCSCLPAWEDISTGLGRFDLKSPDQLTALVVANSIRDKFSGKVIAAKDLPYTTSPADCKDTINTVHCTWWLWEAGNSQKGYDVVVSTNQQRIFQRVRISSVERPSSGRADDT